MEEKLDFTMPDPREDQIPEEAKPREDKVPSAPKKSGKKGCAIGAVIAAVAAALAVGLLLVILICAVVLGGLFAKSPFEKTMHAVFPSIGLWEDVTEDGGTVYFQGLLSEDLVGVPLKEPLNLSANYAFSPDGNLLVLNAGATTDNVDLAVLTNKTGMQVSSDRLLNGSAYVVPFDGIMSAIDTSPFSPDSGTEYALPRDVYNLIKEYTETLEQEQELYEESAKVFAKAADAMLEKAKYTKSRETVSLLDGDTTAKMHTYTIGSDALEAFFTTLADEWENNASFRAEIESADGGEQLVSMIDGILAEIKLRGEPFFEDEFEIIYKYAVKGGYLVYAEAVINTESAGVKESVSFVLRFHKKPKKNPGYELEYLASAGTRIRDGFLFTYTHSKENRSKQWELLEDHWGTDPVRTVVLLEQNPFNDSDRTFTLTVGRDQDVDLADSAEWVHLGGMEVTGTLYQSDELLSLEVDSAHIWDADRNTLFEMTESYFSFRLQREKHDFTLREDGINVLEMSVSELDALGGTLQTSATEALESIGNTLGADFVKDIRMPHAIAGVDVKKEIADYAYDRSNGMLFVAYSYGTYSEIVQYDAATMTELERLHLADGVLCMDADSGYLVFAYDSTAQQYAYVCDSATMGHLKTFDYMDHNTFYPDMEYPGDILVDGNTLIYITGDQHVSLYFTDIMTGETTVHVNAAYEAKLTVDRDRHVVAVLENNLSTCNLQFYSIPERALIREISRYGKPSYLQSSAYFDGTVFWVTANEWYAPDGARGTAEDALDFATRYDLQKVIFRDENIVIVQEYFGSTPFTVYLPDGTFCGALDVVCSAVIPLGNGLYLFEQYDSDGTSLVCCELVDEQRVG